MSDSAGMNDHHDFEGGESKSSSSQESGLCSNMLAIDESMGSLEELSENLHQHLDTHIDHTSFLHYELEMFRSQLTEKNRLITTQQITIKQLQDALNATQKELGEMKKVAELEITCKNETIDVLQSDLIDCQQQHASCLQQVMNQNRVLSEIREDDAVLIEKITQLEKRLRKTSRTVAIQTDMPSRYGENGNRQTSGSYKLPSPSFCLPSSCQLHTRTANTQTSFRSFDDALEVDRSDAASPQLANDFACIHLTSTPQQRKFSEAKCETNPTWSHQFQDLLMEIHQIQKLLLKSTGEPSGRHGPLNSKGSVVRSDVDLTEFWNTITEERQHRLQLDHLIRQLELDVLEVKSQIQSCKARLQVEQPLAPPRCSCCSTFKLCCSAAHQDIANVKHCCTYAGRDAPHPNPRNLHKSASLFTLV